MVDDEVAFTISQRGIVHTSQMTGCGLQNESSQKRILGCDVIVEVNGHEPGPSVSERMAMLLMKREGKYSLG